MLLKHLQTALLILCSDQINTFLYNSSLFFCNFFQSITEKFHVIHSDIRNHRHERLQDVGCILSTAKSCFKHAEIHLFLQVIENRNTHINFKHTEVPFHPAVIKPVSNCKKRILSYILIIDSYTIQMGNHKWRCKASYLVAGCLQDTANIICRTALAIRSGDMNAPQTILRISK